MASISSLMGGSSSTSSIYGNRTTNIISGLASGLDTEAMIEGLVQGYQQKISKLQQENTTLQWQQEAYQSISDKLVQFARKYTSYLSPTTNLFSNSFFNNAIITSPSGTYADLVSASGKSTSDVVLNAVAQLATAARYTSSGGIANGGNTGVVTGDPMQLGSTQTVSTLSGSLSLTYGNQEITIDFGELETSFANPDGSLNTDEFQKAIEEKLAGQDLVINGNTHKAGDLIKVEVDSSGNVKLTDKNGSGNNVSFSGATGRLADKVSSTADGFKVDIANATEDIPMGEYLSGKTLEVSLNGQTKTVTLGEITGSTADDVATALEAAIGKSFGSGKVEVAAVNGALQFDVGSGNTFSIQSDMGEVLGLGESGLTSYVNTRSTLGELLGDDMGGLVANGQGTYDLVINDITVGSYSKDTALETVMNDINSNADAGVNVSYSQLTNQFVFTAKETGEGGRIDFGTLDDKTGEATDLAAALFGQANEVQNGRDAIFQATVNGNPMTLTRSSNTFDLDGMTVTLNGTFNVADGVTSGEIDSANANESLFNLKGESVTFSSKTDTDAIVDVVKQMVEDYNELLTEVKKAYSDQPLTQTDGSRYEPLTDEDKEGMTESEIERYEEKAKTGLLFMDSDLSSLYNALRSAITPGGADGQTLRSIGINTSYSEGLTTISLDEDALRSALETNPDQVRDAFTKSQENGSATNGLMASIKEATDRYASTEGAVKGILIEKAGSQYSPAKALDNTLLNQMNEINEQISRWQEKMSDRVDYYTNKFTQLEVLIQQMNSQSASLSGLMGGY